MCVYKFTYVYALQEELKKGKLKKFAFSKQISFKK